MKGLNLGHMLLRFSQFFLFITELQTKTNKVIQVNAEAYAFVPSKQFHIPGKLESSPEDVGATNVFIVKDPG